MAVKQISLLKHQAEFMNSDSLYTIMKCGRGAGKTFIAGHKILQLMRSGKDVIAIAPTYADVEEVLMQSVLDAADLIGETRVTINKRTFKATLGRSRCLFRSMEKPERLRGPTNYSAVLMDEAALGEKYILDLALACCRGKNVKKPQVFLTTTSRKGSWINELKESPNVKIIRAGTRDNTFLDSSFGDLLAEQYRNNPDFYRMEVLGEECEDEGGSALCTQSVLSKKVLPYGDFRAIGVDVAAEGDDKTVCIYIRGNEILGIKTQRKTSQVSDITHMIKELIKEFGEPHRIAVDTTGLGVFVGAEVEAEFDIPISKVSFAANASGVNKERYSNKRAWIYGNLQEALRRGIFFDGINSKLLKEELLSINFILDRQNRIALDPKSKIKTILGRSPDYADALALCFAGKEVFTIPSDASNISDLLGALQKTTTFKGVFND